MAEIQGRCMKCKEQRVIENMEETTIKGKGGSERRAAKGTCGTCGTKIFKFLPKA